MRATHARGARLEWRLAAARRSGSPGKRMSWAPSAFGQARIIDSLDALAHIATAVVGAVMLDPEAANSML